VGSHSRSGPERSGTGNTLNTSVAFEERHRKRDHVCGGDRLAVSKRYDLTLWVAHSPVTRRCLYSVVGWVMEAMDCAWPASSPPRRPSAALRTLCPARRWMFRRADFTRASSSGDGNSLPLSWG